MSNADYTEFCKNFEKEHKTVKFYIRNKKRQKVALLAGINVSGRILIGWAKCHLRKDAFSKTFGTYLAYERIEKLQKKNNNANESVVIHTLQQKDEDGHLVKTQLNQPVFYVPQIIEKNLPRFTKKLQKYFKLVPADATGETSGAGLTHGEVKAAEGQPSVVGLPKK